MNETEKEEKEKDERHDERKEKLPILSFLRFIESHRDSILPLSSIASVLLTGGLVFYSFMSYFETQKLSNLQLEIANLQHEQFIVENTPVVEILNANTKVDYNDGAFYVEWSITNIGGGYAKDLKCTGVLLGSKKRDLNNFVIDRAFGKTIIIDSLAKPTVRNFVTSENIPGLTEEVEEIKNNGLLFFVSQVIYDIPSELTIKKEKKSEIISIVSIWNNNRKKFFDVNKDVSEQLLKIANEYGYLKSIN